MKKRWFTALWLFGNIILLQAQDVVKVMEHCMQLFQAGKYPETVQLIEDNKPHLAQNEMYASFLYILGIAYTNMSDYPKAETTYLEEKTLHERTLGKEHPGYVNALVSLGYVYRMMGDYAKAETSYVEAKSIREKVSGKEHSGYISSVNDLAGLYHEMGDDAKAETFYMEANAIQEKVLGKENLTYATTLINLATLYFTTGEYVKAETFYQEAIPLLAKVLGKEHPNYAFTLGCLGNVYRVTGDYDKAETFYRDAKTIQEDVVGKDHPAYAISASQLGGLYKDMGDYAKAETFCRDAKAIWEKVLGREHPNHISSLNDLAEVYLAAKNYEEAQTVKTEADWIITGQIEKNFTILSERQRTFFWNKNKHHLEQSYSYAYKHPVHSMIAHVYNNILFTKGLLLRTTNGIRDAVYSSGDRVLMNQYEELRTIRQTISALHAKATPDLHAIDLLEHRADSLDKILTIASGTYEATKKDISMNWQHVRDALQEGEAAVEFVHFRLYGRNGFTDSVFYCAVILKTGMQAPEWIPLCHENQLQTLTKREKGISDDNFTQQLYSGNLYRLAWQPLEKELQGIRTVYYSPSGMLHQIAFAAIPADSVLLSEKYDLQLVSGTREIIRLKKDNTGTLPHGTAVVYGGLYYDVDSDRMIAEASNQNSDPAVPQEEETEPLMIAAVFPKNIQRGYAWGYLPGTEMEAEQICMYLNERKIPNRLYSETQGNEESFKRLNGTPAGIIHLATHGFFLEDIKDETNHDWTQRMRSANRNAFDNPLLRSGLLLAGANRAWTGENIIEGIEDGILTSNEIAQMNLIKTKLAVLSACETGLGEANSAEGVFGLQRAFKLAGVETLVMSLWTVPDDATAELMTAFYQLWLSGKTKREAFAIAQRQVRKQYREPYYWAGFVMMD